MLPLEFDETGSEKSVTQAPGIALTQCSFVEGERHLLKASVLLASVLSLLMPAQACAQVVVVSGGSVRGSEWNGGYLFRGIPFAAPPVDEQRWKPPQAVTPWKGVRDATRQPASCVQNDQGWNYSDYLIGSEDCLTLDVRTPSLNGRFPVLVWIHGGSNRFGGPNDIVLSDVGTQVVVVGIRYRLGIFGFLSHPGLTAQQGGASGNYGIMDQVAALRWVHENIAKFGGDAGNVTIAGESAGSEDVSSCSPPLPRVDCSKRPSWKAVRPVSA